MFDKAGEPMPTTCTLVYAGRGQPTVPVAMGEARADQLLGSPFDALIELAGRVCYDSLGSSKSRNSEAYHAHINETRHHSTHEHATFTAQLPVGAEYYPTLLECLVGRPGLHFERRDVTPFSPTPAVPPLLMPGDPRLRPSFPPGDPRHNPVLASGSAGLVLGRLTMNLRSVREWDAWTVPGGDNALRAPLGIALARLAARMAPLACGDLASRGASVDAGQLPDVRRTPPESDQEVWASLHLENVSRGFSHELVRHGDWTAISQRSTRFVDESSAEWVPHPLILADQECLDWFQQSRSACAPAYDRIVARLQKSLVSAGLDPASARKQARGAARGVLGNALETQLIFSASLSQWKWMLARRASNQADAEIRCLFVAALRLLKGEFPDRFASSDWDLLPARDGVGFVARCGD